MAMTEDLVVVHLVGIIVVPAGVVDILVAVQDITPVKQPVAGADPIMVEQIHRIQQV